MENYREVEGNLITMALEGCFDVIAQGNNCFCTQGAGIAPQMVEAFGTDTFPLERLRYRGNINKLGMIDFVGVNRIDPKGDWLCMPNYVYEGELNNLLYVVNSYTQFNYGKNHIDGSNKPIDYEALTLCMRKINHIFKGKHIGLPWLGTGLAGGSRKIVKQIIQTELKDCQITIVIYKPN